jgi:hypothetical protein
LDFPELIVARVELSSKGKLVYLRMEGSATVFIRLSRFSFAFGSSMTQCTSSTLNQTSVADPSILRYTNFPLLESSTLATINSGKSKLRRMNRVTRDRDPPEKFGTEMKLGESQFTLKTIIRVLGINERHVRRLYRESFI